jgi:hypothetical protein
MDDESPERSCNPCGLPVKTNENKKSAKGARGKEERSKQ